MAATVFFQQFNGASGAEIATAKNADPVQFKTVDTAAVEAVGTATAALTDPRAGVFRSQEVWIQPFLANLGGAAQISNLRAYVTSPNGTAGTFVRYKVSAAYATPAVGGYDAAGAMVAPDGDLLATSSAAPISLGAGPFAVAGIAVGSYLVLQIEGLPNVPQGLMADINLVLDWDEA